MTAAKGSEELVLRFYSPSRNRPVVIGPGPSANIPDQLSNDRIGRDEAQTCVKEMVDVFRHESGRLHGSPQLGRINSLTVVAYTCSCFSKPRGSRRIPRRHHGPTVDECLIRPRVRAMFIQKASSERQHVQKQRSNELVDRDVPAHRSVPRKPSHFSQSTHSPAPQSHFSGSRKRLVQLRFLPTRWWCGAPPHS